MLEAYAVVLAALIAMQLSPGPNLVAVASAAMGRSRRAALSVALGIASGAVIWVVLVAFGLGVVLKAFPSMLTAFKLVGGGYLLWIAFRALRAARRDGGALEPTEGAADSGAGAAAWRRGLFVVLSNPKVALGWAASASYLFGAGLSAWQVAGFAPLAAASALTVYGGCGLLFSTEIAVRVYRRLRRAIETVFGGLFGLMGATLVAAGVHDLRE